MNRYTELLHTHYKSSVLDSLPEWLRNMDDKTSNTADMGMLSPPPLPVLLSPIGDQPITNLTFGKVQKGTNLDLWLMGST